MPQQPTVRTIRERFTWLCIGGSATTISRSRVSRAGRLWRSCSMLLCRLAFQTRCSEEAEHLLAVADVPDRHLPIKRAHRQPLRPDMGRRRESPDRMVVVRAHFLAVGELILLDLLVRAGGEEEF